MGTEAQNSQPNPRYEVVFFDLYGTLIDIRTDEQSDAAWQALYDCVRELGADYGSVEEMRDRFDKLETREMVHQADRAIVRNGWDEFDILPVYRSLLMHRDEESEKKLALPQAALKAAWAFRQGSTSMIRLYPGALDMIKKLQDAGVVVVLLSNAQACYTRPELEMTGLSSVLDDVIISSEEKIRKPARDLYMLALDREFVTAKHALMVGNDERNDIIGANSVGLDAAYFRTEISPADDPQVSEHAVCSFNGADYDGLLKFVLDA
ncbi:HAD family hydrolase [Bifidobacterium ruminantium]|uniref:HAD family hydrolase n=1 Tax=Bifidobacterium ruminantium TaxID=78346 RepID=UPI00255C8988|nr:HAD family hydrolase [Bifidobacterium ruminantium]